MQIKIKEHGKIREGLMPEMNIKFDTPKLDKFKHDHLIANDLDFVKPEVTLNNVFEEVKADWKQVEKFEFKHMDIEKSFKQMLKDI
jgi:superfamily II helicase